MKHAKNPKVVTLVLTWNSADFITECLDSVLNSMFQTDVLVVDNNSADSTREIISERYPHIRIVNTGSNLGYSGGNNLGILHARVDNPKYILILNPDAKLDPACIGKLVSNAETNRSNAVVSPVIYFSDSRRIWYAGSEINWKDGTTPQPGYGDLDIGQFDNVSTTGRANGCAMLVRCSAIDRVGLMDENFFLYYEETDWSVRFIRAGYKIGFEPSAKVWHAVSSSTGGNLGFVYNYYMTRNRLYFMNKYGQKISPLVLMRLFLQSGFRLIVVFKKHRAKIFWCVCYAQLKGYLDYSKRKLGKQTI